MKNYIAPAVKVINISGENLIATSLNNEYGRAGYELSNRRDASESIWGSEE